MEKKLNNDFKEITQQNKINFKRLKNKTFLITGANGFIASYIIFFLIYLNNMHLLNIKLILIGKNKKKISKKFINPISKKFIKIIEQNISDKVKLNGKIKIDYIFHLASNASAKHFIKKPIETSLPNVCGTNNLLKFFSLKKIKCFIFFSSGEIYGNYNGILKEDSINNLDHLNNRSSYAISKKMGESLCYSYFKQKKVPTKIIRLFHSYGPCMNLNDERVMMDFVKIIKENKVIKLKGDGSEQRSFCYISDVLIGIFIILFNGKNGEAYNLANPNETLSIKNFAYKLLKFNKKSKLVIGKKNLSNKNKKVKPSIKKISKIGFKPIISVEEGLKRTLNYYN